MTQKQINFLQALVATRLIIEKNYELWRNDPAAVEAVAEIDSVISFLKLAHQAQAKGSRYITRIKNVTRNSLVVTILWVSGAIFTLAKRNHRPELIDQTDFSESDLRRLADEKLLVKCQNLIAILTENGIETFANFGITPEKFADLNNKINLFNNLMMAPRGSIKEIKAVTGEIARKITEGRLIVKRELQKIFSSYEEEHPQFYAEFLAAKNIVDIKGRSAGKGEEEQNIPPAA